MLILSNFITSQQLWAGRGFTAVRTGKKLENMHKLSGEPRHRLRQTACWAQCLLTFLLNCFCQFIYFLNG